MAFNVVKLVLQSDMTSRQSSAAVEDTPITGGSQNGIFPQWELPTLKKLQKEFAETYTQAEKGEALSKTAEIVRKYNDEMVKRWNEEIDTLLVYAGLFSAILTAFNVQSYLLLQPPATPVPTLAVLQQTSLQLNSFSVNPPFRAVALNTLWFSALICSLASASFGILIKQWLHEYQAGISGSSLEIARLRQYRLNHLVKWHVAEIVAILPVLLQFSLSLFFAGLLVLLWNLHYIVAIVASVLVAIVILFVVVTTILPVFWHDCCYLSPPTYALFSLHQTIRYVGDLLVHRHLFPPLYRRCRQLQGSRSFASLPNFLQTFLSNARTWFWIRARDPVPLRTWRGHEQDAVHKSSPGLDVDILTGAYSTTMDVYTDNIVSCFEKVSAINKRLYGSPGVRTRSTDFWAGVLVRAPPNMDEISFVLTEDFHAMGGLYRSNMTLQQHRRLLLALTAMLAHSEASPDSDACQRTLLLLQKIFSFNAAALEQVPWEVVQYGASLVGSSCGRPSQWDFGVAAAIGVLARCLFAPVSSWARTDEQEDASMLIHSAGLVLDTLCHSSPALAADAGNYAAVVEETLAIGNLQAWNNPVWMDRIVTVHLRRLMRRLETCRAAGIGSGNGESFDGAAIH
ncbi:hypothetical protein BD311DRAFT_792534 [Dichomitus squalens]|uniref:DUF6535 domain-containing protein n=1 Tax=Dichomitus squalens TaxID=114155 RepID=A0A4Q9M4J7_9APHY|nr:hypothetical protein BD311DRAFT_792534 [Dichomitus squalens]